MHRTKKRALLIAGLALILLGAACGAYFGTYAHASPAATALLQGSDTVQVKAIDRGWLLDGPGIRDALVFYPGGKVEPTAYLPLLTALAEDGIDCFLVIAAYYAARHGDDLEGLILLAAYATHPLSDRLAVLELHGSEDGVLNWASLEKGKQYLPASARAFEFPGGNHAQFGDYGPQRGDGPAALSLEEQTAWAAQRIEALIFGE